MQVRSTYRYAKISAFKAREVTREIQGLPVSAALDVVRVQPEEGAALDQQDAEERHRQRGEQQQPARRQPRREGSDCRRRPDAEALDDRGPAAAPARFANARSHIRIVLTDEIEIKTREKKSKKTRREVGKEEVRARAAKQHRKTAVETEPRSETIGTRNQKLTHGTKSQSNWLPPRQ